MADIQANLNEVSRAAQFSKTPADEPRYLLDLLVARKLAVLLAPERDPIYSLVADCLSRRDSSSTRLFAA